MFEKSQFVMGRLEVFQYEVPNLCFSSNAYPFRKQFMGVKISGILLGVKVNVNYRNTERQHQYLRVFI